MGGADGVKVVARRPSPLPESRDRAIEQREYVRVRSTRRDPETSGSPSVAATSSSFPGTAALSLGYPLDGPVDRTATRVTGRDRRRAVPLRVGRERVNRSGSAMSARRLTGSESARPPCRPLSQPRLPVGRPSFLFVYADRLQYQRPPRRRAMARRRRRASVPGRYLSEHDAGR